MREIIKARAKRITLLTAGANLMPTVYKSLDGKPEGEGQFTVVALTKATEEGELLNVVYAPDRVDGHGEWMSRAAVKDMAHAAARDGVEVDLYHDGKVLTNEQAFIAEHFLVQKSDERFHNWKDAKGKDVGSLEGAYATVMKINDPAIRERVKSGELSQVSFEGPALLSTTTPKAADGDDDAPGLFKKLLKAIFGEGSISHSSDNTDMNKQDTEALIAEQIAKALKPEDKSDDKTKTPELDLTDAVAVKKHLDKLQAAELKKGVDFDDPKQVATYLETITKADEDDEDDDELEDEDEDTEEVTALKARTRKAEQRSNRTPVDGDGDEKDIYKGMDKKRVQQLKSGDRMAAFANSLQK